MDIRDGAGTNRVVSDSYVVHLGVAGGVRVLKRGFGPTAATVFNPGDLQILQPGLEPWVILGLRLDRSLVQQELAGLLGRAPDAPVRFDRALDLKTSGAAGLRTLLDGLLAQLDSQHPVLLHPAVQLGQVRSFVTCLLLSHRHSHSEAVARRESPLRPRPLCRALDYIEAHVGEPLTLGDIVRAAGCSARTLHTSFRDNLFETPMSYVRHLRLDRVRDELLHGSEPVSSIAYRWGFTHLGRFAGIYKERFGELPSETMRCRRAVPDPTRRLVVVAPPS